MSQHLTVFAIYETRASVETAADALVKEGFPSAGISVLLPENISASDAAAVGKTNENADEHKRPHDVLSGTLGVLAGLGMLAIPGLGPLVGEGTLKAALAGLGVKSAVGDVARALIHLGVPELEAKRYEDRLQQNAILFAVACAPETAERAAEIIKRTGGQDVSTAAQSLAGAAPPDPKAGRKTARGSG